MTKKAIIFGSIGTIVETSQMQLDAFNMAFAEAGLDWRWSREVYIPMLAKSGGEARIRRYAEEHDTDVDAAALHKRKTALFDDMMVERGLAPRPGVLELVHFAKENEMKVGFASTTSRNNILAIFEALHGALHRSTFDFLGDADRVTMSKPNPEIYQLAMDELGVTASECLAIEDTPVSLKAAKAADIECVGFPGDFIDPNSFDDEISIVRNVHPEHIAALHENEDAEDAEQTRLAS
ncbi:HAD family hydrolase [Yoonia litorea]|uniref:Haloacid dehalogenase superfamily, subfamily IA, variant 3 with third motif having DD or ED n=1 Tax=Yoonia litorea TaxID=1123755 RepID=A0A1I6MZZ0_9RHOB|nr:HAD-IA family hydrolase [Yoonia litorea]SFS21260.1 haloacid dehalogenase superfamily, subfamily IA, variant 3 with third motif having DD or ED [Yoonia litorea]